MYKTKIGNKIEIITEGFAHYIQKQNSNNKQLKLTIKEDAMTKTKDIKKLIDGKELWLRNCREQINSPKIKVLSWQCIIDIANLLKDNAELQTLELEGRKIDNQDAKMYGSGILAEALEQNCTLRHLGLADNNIDDVGAIALSEALRKNKSLKYLYLFDNNIGNAGAIALAQALKINKSLRVLELSGNNKISNIGATFLMKVFKAHTSLKLLRLEENQNISSANLDDIDLINQKRRNIEAI